MISSKRLPPPLPARERYGPVQASLGPVELHLVLEAGGHHQGAGLGEVRRGGERLEYLQQAQTDGLV